jgi:hypothetical protein
VRRALPAIAAAAFLAAASPAAALGPLYSPDPPRHPHMAPNGKSTLHVDAYQTDVHQGPGPLGRGTSVVSATYISDCASHTFTTDGKLVTVCVGVQNVTLRVLDARTLETLDSFELPPRPFSANTFQNFTGGGYFYLDDQDRAIVPTASRHVFVIPTRGGVRLLRDVDLTAHVPEGDAIISALPDWSGRIWFASRQGVVGTISENGTIGALATREPIGNSFATDSDGSVSIVTDVALYRFVAAQDGVPRPTWRFVYGNDHAIKPGQTQAGSGTTPTLVGRDRVAITDNADPIAVVLLDRRTGELLCRAPVFGAGSGSTDQSLIATPEFAVVENNYGYTGPAATLLGGTTRPGLARVDFDTCKVRWVSNEIAPTVVPKLSAANGLVYTYTKPAGDLSDPWYLTALDVADGKTIFSVRAGSGLGANNNYAPITLGPDGTAYVGVLEGILAIRDATPPAGKPRGRPAKPRIVCRAGAPRVTGRYVRSAKRTKSRSRVHFTVVERDGRVLRLSAKRCRRR